MTFSYRQGTSLLEPLTGQSATFVMDGRDTNLRFARTLMKSLAEAAKSCIILDLDAFYSSNSDQIFMGPHGRQAERSIRVPLPGSDVEAEFSRLFETTQDAIVIDSMNSFYHLISEGNGSARGRKMKFALASLSQFASANNKAVILSMYGREGLAKSGRGRQISSLSDVTASVSTKNSEVEIRTERGPGWPGGSFPSRNP